MRSLLIRELVIGMGPGLIYLAGVFGQATVVHELEDAHGITAMAASRNLSCAVQYPVHDFSSSLLRNFHDRSFLCAIIFRIQSGWKVTKYWKICDF